MSNNARSFETEFKLEPDDHRLHREHCKANLKKIQDIGRHRHEQVRIEFDTTNRGLTGAIYTVSAFHPDQGSVILGPKIDGYLQNCKLDNNKCYGTVKDQITIDGLSEEDAKDKGEFIELLNAPNIQNRKLIVIAPHGGNIEPWTDEQEHYMSRKIYM